MDEPRTHYQISLTSGQAAGAFVVLVVLLLASYFLGLLTGLSGRGEKAPARVAVAAAPTPSPEPAFPKPVLGVTPRGGRPAPSPSPVPEPSPAATATIQLFSDRTGAEPTPAPAKAGPSKAAAAKPTGKAAVKPTATPGFWVQVDSLSSKEQAESRQRGLKAAGFSSTIVPGTGSKGPVYRVRTGPYATREDAERAATKLAEKAKVKPWVVPPGQ